MANRQFNLLEPFVAQGYWWHPDHAHHKVVGTLSFSPDSGVTLELTNSILPDFPQDIPLALQSHGTIWGQLLEGPLCTLVMNTAVSRSFRHNQNVTSERFSSQYLLLGIHQEAFEDRRYIYSKVEFTNLDSWVSHYPFSIDSSHENENRESVNYERLRMLFQHYIASRECDIRIYHLMRSSLNIHTFALEAHKEIYMQASEPQSFRWYRQLAYDVRNLLVLFTTFPIYFINMSMEYAREGQEPQHFRVFFAQRNRLSAESPFRDMLLKFPDIEDVLPGAIDKWIELSDRMRPVHDLFFGYIYRPDVFISFRFLSLMQSLETYHRAKGNGYFVDGDTYNRIAAVLEAALPNEMDKDLRQALKNRLLYGNEYSLSRRLKELFRTLTKEGMNLLDPDWKSLVRRLADYRNYLTHYDNANKPVDFSEQNLFYMSEQLRSLLTLLLFKDIGIDEELAIKAIQKHPSLWPWH